MQMEFPISKVCSLELHNLELRRLEFGNPESELLELISSTQSTPKSSRDSERGDPA